MIANLIKMIKTKLMIKAKKTDADRAKKNDTKSKIKLKIMNTDTRKKSKFFL